jgi:hypothetical protein
MSLPCDCRLDYNRLIRALDKLLILTDPPIWLTTTTKTKSGGLAGTNSTGLSNWYLLFTYYLMAGGEQLHE